MEHTPGPWEDSQNASDAIISRDPDAIKRWLGDNPDDVTKKALEYYGGGVIAESVAPKNKPLIKAAPDLLAACELDKQYIRHLHICPVCRSGGHCDEGTQLWAKSGTARDAAIAKAKGE